MTSKKKEILETFISTSKKIGKLATVSTLMKFGISRAMIRSHFGNHTGLIEEALQTDPTLEHLKVQSSITSVDLENLRINLISNTVKKNNQELLTNVNSLDYLKKFIEELKIPEVKSYKTKNSKNKTDRIITLFLSDLHIGADVLREETGTNEFGKVEEARRLAALIKQTIEYKIHHRDSTDLEVILNGDIIQGMLGHDPRDGAPVAEQVARSIYLLTQALEHLAHSFKKVTVRCATGNHGRIISRTKGRAVKQKWDGFETIIYYSLKNAFRKVENMQFDIPKTPYVSYNIFDKKVLVTHGDNVISVGNPSKSLNISNIENQINRINASLKDLEEYSLILIGHVHSPSISFLGNGAAVMTNGCMVGTDDFSVSLGHMETPKAQWLFESVKGIPLGDARLIRLDDNVDKDASLDSIIKPWSNF